MKIRKYTQMAVLGITLAGCLNNIMAQESTVTFDYQNMTLDQMRKLTQEDLVNIPFEELIGLVKKFKLSSIDELYQMILNPTQTTASKKSEDVFNSPLTTVVITGEEIIKSGARTIPEALRLAPGIIVREQTNGNYDIHIRGNDFIPPGSDLSNSTNNTTLVMIDNRPVFNNYVGATFWENLPIEIADLDRIEIVYGPASALYGANAVSGVIHLITATPDKEGWHSEMKGETSPTDWAITARGISYATPKTKLRLSGNYKLSQRFQESYYIPNEGRYVNGNEVGSINAATDSTYNASSFSDDYKKALEKFGINFFFDFKPTDKLNISYDASYQQSEVQTAYMNIGSVLSTRKSETFTNNINAAYKNFDFNLSGITGHLNAIEGLPGYEYDFTELNTKLAYNWKYKNLLIRPGIDANYSIYSDKDYVDEANYEGLLNGSAELGTVQASIRADYTAFKRLRIVGAWMQGFFYEPSKHYHSYQFTTSYKLNDNMMMRAVASRANSSPFILSSYTNRQISIPQVTGSTNTSTISQMGNPDMKPLEMNMYEFGMRNIISKKIQTDLSVFYNRTQNYSTTMQSMQTLQMPTTDITTGTEAGTAGTIPTEATPSTNTDTQMIQQTINKAGNSDIKSEQIGITASIKFALNEKFNAGIFATWQKTSVLNYSINDSTTYHELTGNTLTNQELRSTNTKIDFTHTYTPDVYGGATLNYKPVTKLNIGSSAYAYSKQKTFYTVNNQFQWITIDPKVIWNLNVSYDVNKWLQVTANARNLLNNTSKEFIFTDDTGSSYLVGLTIKL